MSRFKVTSLVARREIRERTKSKSFWNSTAISLVMILALAVLPGLLSDEGPTTYRVGVDDASAAVAERLASVAAGLPGATDPAGVEVAVETEVVDAAEAERLVASGDLDAAVVGGEVVVNEELEQQLGFLVQEASRQVDVSRTLAASGVGEEVAGRVLAPEPLAVRALDAQDEETATRRTLTFFGMFLLIGQIFGFGFYVAGGVVEEKSSRVVECCRSAARRARWRRGSWPPASGWSSPPWWASCGWRPGSTPAVPSTCAASSSCARP